MTVLRGDCNDVMAGVEPDSVDAIVTDPPYGLEFMGKEWDSPSKMGGTATHRQWAAAALRVAKPGAYLLAFGGTRTVHRMTVALEDAGWIVRDMLVWAYAQGFPKSKASLKPAWEPIVLCRKPGPLRELGIDAARIATDERWSYPNGAGGNTFHGQPRRTAPETQPEGGRWPANVILTDPIFDGGWDGVVGGGETTTHPGTYRNESSGNWFGPERAAGFTVSSGDSGTYSRFFLLPKAPTSERVLSDGRRSPHPTQKPEALIRHLVKLVVPEGGLVLDPFLGSGTLGVVCDGLGIRWLGIEREAEYADWAEDRIRDGRPRWDVA